MGFLGDLAGAISSQFGVGENNNRTLNSVVLGQDVKYGQLGDFANKFDQSAQRRYVEEGYLRIDPYNMDSKQFEVLFQEPNATVFIKKKMFSSIAENFRPDFMDQDEKLYYRALRVLFQNKCNVIAALEKLSKIQQVTSTVGSISDQLVPIISTLSDTISSNTSNPSDLFGGFTGGLFGGSADPTQLASVMNQVRKIYGFNTTNTTTTWITDSTNLFQSQFAQGTGVIEITNFTNLSTMTTVEGVKNPGSFNLTIVDPYESMLITDWDIEKAIADATNMWSSHNLFNFAQTNVDQTISDNLTQLNQFRTARGAGSISIQINPNTLLGQRVTAIIDRLGIELVFSFDSGFLGVGSSASVAPDYLKGGEIAGAEGLDSSNGIDAFGVRHLTSELNAFSNAISSIYSKIQLDQNSRNAFQVTNKNTNYARQKLRFNFSGQLVIQPMDVVHIYMSSKSRFDNKLLSGLQNMFAGGGILQNINNTVTSLANTATSLFSPAGNIDLQLEKSVYVGSNFPNYLWTMLRSQFVTEKEGIHVFAGLVDGVGDSWRDGKFTADITGRDNIAYFEQGKINFKPGVDAFNGAIFDPLTPFKTSFDTITSNAKDNTPQLLDENIAILGTSQDKRGLLKAKAGPNAGQKITSDTFFQGTLINKNTSQVSREIFAPDGLVYKWKDGIGVFVQFGNSLDMNDPNKVGNPSIYKEPFAGQDVMNTISLLITGQPYNYANFWKASASLYGFNNDPQSGQNSAATYISSLKSQLTKNNLMWGNFIPFKSLSIDEQSFALAMQAQFRIVGKNNSLDSKLSQLSNLNNQAALFSAANIFAANTSNNFNPQFLELKSQLTTLQSSIQQDISDIQQADTSFNQLATSAGPDASYDFSNFTNSSSTPVSAGSTSARKSLRRKLNYLTRRMSYDVRANQDKNLFIVDDFYDKDYDILAYEQSLTDGLKLYNNEFTSTREKIMNTADLLNLEVFCDTQGHIRVRPPQYNKMPSSVFYRMLYLKQAYGIQIFPQFLSDLFGNQIDTLRKQIEIMEDMIRLYCAVLGHGDDVSATGFILNSGSNNGNGSPFNFISDSTGSITDVNQLLQSVNDPSGTQAQSFLGSSPAQSQAQVQGFLSSISSQAGSTKTIFSNSQRYSVIVNSLTQTAAAQNGNNVAVSTLLNNTYVQNLITRIQTKSGQSINKNDFISTNANGQQDVVVPSGQFIDVFKVTTDLQQQLQARQKQIKLFYSSIKNATEYQSLDAKGNTTGNQLLSAPTYGNSNVPEVFAHMIEDENYDDYGPGSSSRYIIKRAQIRDLQFHIQPPDFTMVEVQGVLNTFAPNALPEGLNSFPDNGNGLVSAVAVDYSSWRNYGFKNSATIKVPFLSDPNSQCGPYASMILSRNRKNIIQATCTISGNEYMQPGEVVFLQDRQMLFYVVAVRHNFTFGSGFTTTLDLKYGHSSGDYIPTTLDVIGKMLYNNRDIAGYTIQRQTNTGNESSLGAVIMNPSGSSLSADNSSTPTSFSTFNNQVINNILYTAAYTVNANNTAGNNVTANVELRIYYDNNNSASSALQSFAGTIQSMLTGSGTVSNEVQSPSFPSNAVNIVTVSMDDTNDRRSPSQKAIDAARNQSSSSSVSTGVSSNPAPGVDKIRTSLFSYIVDCWLVYTNTGS